MCVRLAKLFMLSCTIVIILFANTQKGIRREVMRVRLGSVCCFPFVDAAKKESN